MFYPSTAGSVTSFVTPGYPAQRSYYPAAPMSAVMPGQHYYPTMHAPMVYPQQYPQQYGYTHHTTMPYYAQQPTVIVSSAPSRRHRRSRSRHGGFLGYL